MTRYTTVNSRVEHLLLTVLEVTVCLSCDSLEYRHGINQRTEQRLISFNKDSPKSPNMAHTVLPFLGPAFPAFKQHEKIKCKHRKGTYSPSGGVHGLQKEAMGRKEDEEPLFPSPLALTAQPRLVLNTQSSCMSDTLDYMVCHIRLS